MCVWCLIRGAELKRLSSELKVPGSNPGHSLRLADDTKYGFVGSGDPDNDQLEMSFVRYL